MRLSIRSALIAAIVGLVAVTVAVILMGTVLSSESVILDQIGTNLARDAARASNRTAAFLEPTAYTSSLTAELIESNPGWVDPDNQAPLIDHFGTVLDQRPEVSGIFFGSAEGEFVYLSRNLGSSPGVRRIKRIEMRPDRTTTLTWLDESGAPVASTEDSTDTYDPRSRPWYQLAAELDGQRWTDPYVFFTSQQPGVSSSAPVVAPNGTLIGAVGIDIDLGALSGFLAELQFTEHGSAYLIDSDLQVLAHSEPGKAAPSKSETGLDLIRLDELDDDAALVAFEKLAEVGAPIDLKEATSVSVETGSELVVARFAPVGVSDWVVAVQVPRSDYLGAFERNRRFNFALAISIGILASGLGYVLAEAITRPIRQLRASGQAIQSGHVPAERVRSRFAEIDDTALALHEAHSLLEQRVAARTAELHREVTVRREAELRALAANNAKSEFLANVSHELRTPLTAVIGYAALIKGMGDDLSPDELMDHIAVIDHAGNHLLELINDLLDLAKIEAGQMPLDEAALDLAALVESVGTLMGPRARKKGVTLTVSADERLLIWAEERRLRQIILNLVSNAIKFTLPGGWVAVRAGEGPAGAWIEVKDTGIGMTPDELTVALEMFGQNRHDGVTTEAGTGLGLVLSKSLVESHGGTLEIESQKGEGTTVRVALPAERIQAMPALR